MWGTDSRPQTPVVVMWGTDSCLLSPDRPFHSRSHLSRETWLCCSPSSFWMSSWQRDSSWSLELLARSSLPPPGPPVTSCSVRGLKTIVSQSDRGWEECCDPPAGAGEAVWGPLWGPLLSRHLHTQVAELALLLGVRHLTHLKSLTEHHGDQRRHIAHCTLHIARPTPVRLWWSPCVDCGSGAARPVAPGLALDCTPASGRSAWTCGRKCSKWWSWRSC